MADILETVIDAGEKNIEYYESSIESALFEFSESQGYENPREMTQSVWNAALNYCNKHCITKKDLKVNSNIYINNTIMPTNCQSYDFDKVNSLCDLYINLCMTYDKECSIIGFSFLSGINYETLEEWKRGDKATSRNSVIPKKIAVFREESLSNKLAGGKANPVGILAILNHHYGWNLPGVSREPAKPQANVQQIAAQMGVALEGQDVKAIEAKDGETE